MRAVGTIALLGALVLMLASAAQGAGWSTFAADSGRGQRTAAAPVFDPGSLRVKISTAQLRKKVVFSTTIKCDGSRTKKHTYERRTNIVKKIAKPVRNPDMCIVGASAKRRGGGRVVVKLQQR